MFGTVLEKIDVMDEKKIQKNTYSLKSRLTHEWGFKIFFGVHRFYE